MWMKIALTISPNLALSDKVQFLDMCSHHNGSDLNWSDQKWFGVIQKNFRGVRFHSDKDVCAVEMILSIKMFLLLAVLTLLPEAPDKRRYTSSSWKNLKGKKSLRRYPRKKLWWTSGLSGSSSIWIWLKTLNSGLSSPQLADVFPTGAVRKA